MEKIVNLVSERAGISTEQAQVAVDTIAKFLKDKMPPAMAGQVDNYLKGNGTGDDGGIAGAAGKLGSGMFGKK
ncbi:hypothetical protein [Salinimicrobium terrae]|uniref:hypothetical protein n=1 Tax=Salinimicrobium terrae TaxID=470866 RepID=UPI000422FE0F|nr:hypothetical protein [Salinimicrobium terrae]